MFPTFLDLSENGPAFQQTIERDIYQILIWNIYSGAYQLSKNEIHILEIFSYAFSFC